MFLFYLVKGQSPENGIHSSKVITALHFTVKRVSESINYVVEYDVPIILIHCLHLDNHSALHAKAFKTPSPHPQLASEIYHIFTMLILKLGMHRSNTGNECQSQFCKKYSIGYRFQISKTGLIPVFALTVIKTQFSPTLRVWTYYI